MNTPLPPFSMKAAGLRWVVPATSLGVAAVAVLTVVAALAADGRAVAGVLVGGAAVLLTSLFAVVSLTMVVATIPRLAQVIALMTYLTQVMVLLLLWANFEKHPEMRRELAGAWLGGGIIAACVAWTVGYVIAAYRARHEIPSSWGEPRDEAGAQ